MPEAEADERVRCEWAGDDPDMRAYHDEEWGVPVHEERHLFEMLTLEGAQAGLSWLTILKRRATYRLAFEDFDVERIAAYGEADRARLLADVGIIRNRAKVAATISNAQAVLELRADGTTLNAFLWGFVGGEPRRNTFKTLAEIPSETDESTAMSKGLKKRGFRFVGPTICYALMQAVGMVNDHTPRCFRYGEV